MSAHDRGETVAGLLCGFLVLIMALGGVYACHDKFEHERASLTPKPEGAEQ